MAPDIAALTGGSTNSTQRTTTGSGGSAATAELRVYRPRCRYCGDTLHWLGAGWGHDSNNMATCLRESERRREWVGAIPEDITPLAERAQADVE